MCWLPTDFYASEGGSVAIRSYINNLHPVRYAALYGTISKAFAKFVPLLEQIAADMIHPRSLRAEFGLDFCITPRMLHLVYICNLAREGAPIPKEYHKFIVNNAAYCKGKNSNKIRETNGIEIDITKLVDEYEDAEEYNEPPPKPFGPSDRPLKPYSMRGLPLQASVDMTSIDLMPENPAHPEGEWQAVGRAEERIFAVGIYFYDVENIASPKLKFRDPVWQRMFDHPSDYRYFCFAHDAEELGGGEADQYPGDGCDYTREVGTMEVKSSTYLCYPNFYQTKMSSFGLADPTMPGHLKYIAFYIADPTRRLISTEIVPPQQPGLTDAADPLDTGVEAISNSLSKVKEFTKDLTEKFY
ncbi:hypothetical protein GGI20_002439 [Coemansia sp. BCRC 34301]|nr:hypothetical protein GGI20_002439 [Coemansia sp. BCRC 34301]